MSNSPITYSGNSYLLQCLSQCFCATLLYILGLEAYCKGKELFRKCNKYMWLYITTAGRNLKEIKLWAEVINKAKCSVYRFSYCKPYLHRRCISRRSDIQKCTYFLSELNTRAALSKFILWFSRFMMTGLWMIAFHRIYGF